MLATHILVSNKRMLLIEGIKTITTNKRIVTTSMCSPTFQEFVQILNHNVVRLFSRSDKQKVGVVLAVSVRWSVDGEQVDFVFSTLFFRFIYRIHIHGELWILFFKFRYLFDRKWELESFNVEIFQVFFIMIRLIRNIWIWRFPHITHTIKKTKLVSIFNVHGSFLILYVCGEFNKRRPSDNIVRRDVNSAS